MTIQEAIRSGKPFRRKSANVNYWFVLSHSDETFNGSVITRNDTNEEWNINVKSLLADDWEIKNKPLEYQLLVSKTDSTDASILLDSGLCKAYHTNYKVITVREVLP